MDRKKGIRARSGSGIEIDFTYKGRRCRETLKLSPTPANKLYAARKRGAILYEIAQGSFNYSKHFPNSPKAKGYAGGSLQTVGQALDLFIKAARNRCSHSTLRDYQSAIDYHLKPVFGEKLLTEISTADIKAWMGFLQISPKRINNVLTPLRGVLGDAFADGLIDRNPADRVKNLPHRTEEPDPLAPVEIEKLLASCPGQIRNLFQFAIWTGLRTSELIALEWGDIDWIRGIARIRRASVRKQVKVPKTQAGERDIKLLSGALAALQDQKSYTFLHAKQVFFNPRTNASWETDAQIRKTAWQPAIRRAGIRDRNPYQTRHTFASLCLTAGEDIAWVARQLGHKSIAMTLKSYARWIEGIETSGGEKMTRLLSQSGHRSVASA
ncbi:MAG: site-specific integrase [Burkholderiales bacterium]|nr:site-specific integrase [Burkholderiales bacterium]